MGTQDIQGVYKVYSITRVNTGTQDIHGYTEYIGVYKGIPGIITYCTNILGSLYGDCHELLAPWSLRTAQILIQFFFSRWFY